LIHYCEHGAISRLGRTLEQYGERLRGRMAEDILDANMARRRGKERTGEQRQEERQNQQNGAEERTRPSR